MLLADHDDPGAGHDDPHVPHLQEHGFLQYAAAAVGAQHFGTAFFIFMARQFLKSIPRELEEAAHRNDGCGFFRIYWHIMLP